MKYLGKININIYHKVTDKKIITDDVIITDDQIQHIINRRGQNFYDEYNEYFPEIISNPDYIFEDKKENTAIVVKSFIHKNTNINIILRLVVSGDNPEYKNSVITVIKENNKRFAQRLRNNVPIYKNVDT